jgi:hypothetical protein
VPNLQAGSSPMTLILFLFALFVLPMFTSALGNDSRSLSGDFPYSSSTLASKCASKRNFARPMCS